MALPKRPAVKTSLKSSMLRDWAPQDVAQWLEDINDGLFSQYADYVFANKITGVDLMNLTPQDMKSKLCITIPNHILTLSASIDILKNRSGGSHRKHSPVPRASGSIKVSLDDLLDIRIPSINETDSDDASSSTLKTHSAPAPDLRQTKSLYIPVNFDDKRTKNRKLKHNDKPDVKKMKRAKTLSMKFNKKRQNTIALKEELTQKNQRKQDNNFHKDLGKKLWPNETSSIVKEGWMKKRGVRRSGFKERWCILRDNGHLYYFGKRPSEHIKNDLPQGMLDLNHVLKIEYVQDDDPNTFNVKTDDRDWIFSAISGGQLVQWMSALNKTLVTIRK